MSEQKASLDSNQATEVSDSLVGTLFESRFQILSLLGTGATGSAYKAMDVHLQREVAVKIIHGFLLVQSNAIERFKQEARTCTLLDHPGIAKVYASGIAADGRPYMVMDLLDGKTLSQLIKEEHHLSLERFFPIFIQLCDALAYAHEQGVVHRDVKPSNIVILPESDGIEKAVVVDFGIAKIVDQGDAQNVTRTGALLGSSAYMSPEQCKASPIDERSDIYSLGCVMFESLVGQAPYAGESALDVMYKHLNESLGQLGFLKEMPDSVSGLIGKCLQKKPENRFQSMRELKDELEKSSMMDTGARKWEPAKVSSKKQPLVLLAMLALLFLVFAGVAYRFTHVRNLVNPDLNNLDNNLKKAELPPAEQVVPRRSQVQLDQLIEDYKQRGRPGDVIIILESWWKQFGNNAEVLHQEKIEVQQQLAARYEEAGRLDDALAANNVLVRLSPGNIMEYLRCSANIARIYRAQTRIDEALALLQKVRKQYPTELASVAYAEKKAELDAAEADCLADLGQWEKAIEKYRTCIAVFDKRDSKKGNHHFWNNGYRMKLVRVLVKSNRPKKEIDAVLEDCIDAHKETGTNETAFDIYTQALTICNQTSRGDLAMAYANAAVEWSKKHHQRETEAALLVAQIEDAGGPPIKLKQIYKARLKTATKLPDKISLMISIASLTFADDRRQALDICKNMLAQIEEEMKVHPDLLWNNSNPIYGAAISSYFDYLWMSGRKVEAAILSQAWLDKMQGHECENLVVLLDCQMKLFNFRGEWDKNIETSSKTLRLLFKPDIAAECRRNGSFLEVRRIYAFNYRINAYKQKGLYDKAISDIKQTLLEAKRCQLPDSCAQQYYQLANTLDLSGKFDEADQAFKDMMAWNRMDRKGMTATTAAQIRDYGLFKMRRGDLAEAERLLRLALLHAKTSYVQNLAAARIFEVDLAVLLDRRGKKNEANSLLEHVIKVSDRPLLKDAIYQRAIKLLASSNSSQQAIVPVH